MRKLGLFIVVLIFFAVGSISAQNVTVEGFVFASNNTGYLEGVEITAYFGETPLITASTDRNGQFSMSVPAEKELKLLAKKQGFEETESRISTVDKDGEVVYVKISMARAAGYIFEATLSELVPSDHEGPIDALTEATVEIYNNTEDKEVLVLKDHPKHTFSFTFEKGNQYTIMIRKKGFFTKRLQANVDINDCLLCFEGIGTIRPAVSDNLTLGDGYQSGVLATDIKLKRVVIGEPIEINNIYYDLAKWDLREESLLELDKLAGILRDNPHLLVQLGSHTDSRGSTESNNTLSAKRAKSTRDYLILKGVEPVRMTSTGYGESKLKNKCKDGVDCSERKHQENRRTDFTVTGILSENPYDKKTLAKIIQEEKFEQMLRELESSVVQVPIKDSTAVEEKAENTKALINDPLGGDMETMEIPKAEEIVEIPEEPVAELEKTAKEEEKPAPKAEIIEEPIVEEVIETPVKVVEEVIETPVKVVEEVIETPVKVVEEVIETPVKVVEEVIETPVKVVEEVIETPVKVVEEVIETPVKVVEEVIETPVKVLEEVIETPVKVEEEIIETPAKVEEETSNENAASFIFSGSEDLAGDKEIKEATAEKPAVADKIEIEPSSLAEQEEALEKAQKEKDGVVISSTKYRHPSEKEKDNIIPAPIYEDESPPSNEFSAEDLAVQDKLMPPAGSEPLVNKLARGYTGFKIEIATTDIELPLTHDIFKEFGKLDVELNVEKKYHYLMGDFRNGNLAQTFLQRSILQRYPNARVVHFQGGERIDFE